MTPYEQEYESESPPKPCTPCQVFAAMRFVETTDAHQRELPAGTTMAAQRQVVMDDALKVLSAFFRSNTRESCNDE